MPLGLNKIREITEVVLTIEDKKKRTDFDYANNERTSNYLRDMQNEELVARN